MTFGKTKKLAVLIAAAAALLAVSVSAAVLWLTPAQVADFHNQPLLAEAFAGKDAILLNETISSGDYAITLLGLTSGERLTTWDQDADTSHTYAVLALRRLDGNALETQDFNFTAYTMTPLVAGYAPAAVNSWTLNALATGFAHDGVYYYLLDTQDLGMFADHTVYMAFYEGGAPSNSIFTVGEDGSIAFAEDFTAVQALFTLPLDPSLADPQAADAFAEETGLNHWSNDRTVDESIKDGVFIISEDGAPGSITSSFHTAGGEEELDLFTAETYEAYMIQEQARLRQLVEQGELSQEQFSASVKEMEDTLEGIRNGTALAARLDGGGVFSAALPAPGDLSADDQALQSSVSATIRNAE